MEGNVSLEGIDPVSAIYAVSETLKRIDNRLIDHGERVAYIARKICEKSSIELDDKNLFILSLFHDIGAYETDEIDRMLQFETQNVQKHSVYGYLFMKYLTPVKDSAEAILYHHSSWNDIEKSGSKYGGYAEVIQLADRIDVVLSYQKDKSKIVQILQSGRSTFNEELFEATLKCLDDDAFLYCLKSEEYHENNLRACEKFITTADEALDYLKMIVYSIDFRSDHTVTHTINTVEIAVNIARHFEMSEYEIKQIYIGALLHDIGKIAIPLSILEYPGRLSDEKMAVMRTHVEETDELIKGIVPEEIRRIAIRHHEKLDGKGYPLGLSADELTFSERIVAVADIVSALGSRRSYKEPFPKDKTIAIIGQMKGTQLDVKVCDYVTENYDEIMASTEASRVRVIDKYRMIRGEYERIMRE